MSACIWPLCSCLVDRGEGWCEVIWQVYRLPLLTNNFNRSCVLFLALSLDSSQSLFRLVIGTALVLLLQPLWALLLARRIVGHGSLDTWQLLARWILLNTADALCFFLRFMIIFKPHSGLSEPSQLARLHEAVGVRYFVFFTALVSAELLKIMLLFLAKYFRHQDCTLSPTLRS